MRGSGSSSTSLSDAAHSSSAGNLRQKQLPDFVGKLNTALHLSIVSIALSIAFVLFDTSLFSWHPVFMSMGYIIFMAEGLISAVMFRHLDGGERVRAIESHALMQLRALVCIAVGFGVIYRNKMIAGKPHFVSTHAKFGLATLVLSVVLPLVGVISFRKMGFIQKFPERWQPRIKMLHKRAGVFTWLLALVTIELALPHKAVNKGLLTNFWQAGVAIIGVLMMTLMVKAVVKVRGGADDPMSKAV